MIDLIFPTEQGLDLGVANTQTERAANILSVQIGALEYAQDLGIDLAFFLSEGFSFQLASFQSYLVQILANWGINVAELLATNYDLFSNFEFNLAPEENSTGLIAR